MQNNYFFIKHLSSQLNELVVNKIILECFSQNKEELVIKFANNTHGNDSFYIQANLNPTFTCLYFPEKYHRARSNSVDLFENLVGKKAISVSQHSNERAFTIHFSSQIQLCFKMFGNKANILLFENKKLAQIFKTNLKADYQISYYDLDRKLDLTYENFQINQFDIAKTLPTLGKENINLLLCKYHTQNNTNPIDYQALWHFFIEETSTKISQKFYLIKDANIPKLSLWHFQSKDYEVYPDPVLAINRFYQLYSKLNGIIIEKQTILATLNTQIKKIKASIQEVKNRLNALKNNIKNEEIGHIIMANIHQIKPNTDTCILFDFYRNQNISIKLKKDISPQKNAENYYRKAKNESKEIENLMQRIEEKSQKVMDLINHLNLIENITDIKDLRKYLKDNKINNNQNQNVSLESPFKVVTYETFEIWIGKNAQNNDLLTTQYAKKDDLWLHARDVAGSHVVIKQQAGKPFPKTVIERAAQLAAYYSKRKTDSVCPVIVTPKKYIRKAKNMAIGKVIVEKEETILVTPSGP